MKNLNPGAENGRRNGVVGLGLRPDQVPTTINIKVSHGRSQYELAVPSNSSFADLKSIIAKEIGLKLENHKLLFRGKEKDDDEYLETAGVKENSKVLLVEDTTHEQKSHEEVKETSVTSKGGEAVAEIKKEVDKLSEQVSTLQATLDSGKKVDEKNIIFLTEMLMRQLLKLDGIDAEGEGKIQRKMEVRRVQSLVDTMDVLKSRNSNPSSNVVENSVPVTTQWESFEPAHESANSPSAPAHAPSSSSSPVPSSIPSHVPPPAPGHVPSPAPAPSHVPPAAPGHAPAPTPSHVPSAAHGPATPSSSSHSTSSATLYYTPSSTSTPSYGPSSYASPYHYDVASSHAPYPHETPLSHAPYPYVAPYPPTHYAPTATSSYGPSPHAPPYHYEAPSSYASFPHETPPSHASFPHGAPYVPTHYVPNPYARAPYPPNAYETAPYASNLYASSYHTPPPMPSHDSSGAQPYDPSSGPPCAPTMPSSTKVTRDWERFE